MFFPRCSEDAGKGVGLGLIFTARLFGGTLALSCPHQRSGLRWFLEPANIRISVVLPQAGRTQKRENSRCVDDLASGLESPLKCGTLETFLKLDKELCLAGSSMGAKNGLLHAEP